MASCNMSQWIQLGLGLTFEYLKFHHTTFPVSISDAVSPANVTTALVPCKEEGCSHKAASQDLHLCINKKYALSCICAHKHKWWK